MSILDRITPDVVAETFLVMLTILSVFLVIGLIGKGVERVIRRRHR